MKFNISELLKKKVDELAYDLTFKLEYLERDDFRINFISPLNIKGKAINNSDIIETVGTIKVNIEVQCSRCLEPFNHLLDVDFEENFSKSSDDEDFYPIIEGEMILDDMVMDNLILSMPLSSVCCEECKGLCHTCGVNLNKVDCDCEKEVINPKFAALKDLFKQN